MVAILATFMTGLGIIMSIVLLILISSENKLLQSNLNIEEVAEDLRKLKTTKTLSIVNIILNAVLMVLGILLLILVFVIGYNISWK